MTIEIEIFDPKKFRDVKWKNGGGITRELFRRSIGEEDYVYRISVANIESDGAFSRFDGYMRALVMLEGSIMLEHNQSEVKLTKGESYRFQGAWETRCKLISKDLAKDFNFIYRPQLVSVQVASIHLKNTLNLRINGDEEFLYGVEGSFEILNESGDKLGSRICNSGDLIGIRSSSTNALIKIKPSSSVALFLVHVVVKYRSANSLSLV